MGGMDSGGNKVVSTVISDAGHGKKGLDIQIRVESRKERLRQELERLRPPAAE